MKNVVYSIAIIGALALSACGSNAEADAESECIDQSLIEALFDAPENAPAQALAGKIGACSI